MAATFTAGDGFAPDAPAALGLDEVLKQVARDDQDEWEYEYSTTETETYYLTLELSYPEFKERRNKAPHHSRGGYYKNWLDHSSGEPSAMTTGPKQGNDGDLSDDDNDDDAGGDDGVVDDAPPLDPLLQAESKGLDGGDKAIGEEKETGQEKELAGESMEEIQILDLHSLNPVISYRGRLFEGQWAEVIGTEAILAKNDGETPLPALRNLAEGVDVLAASSSRIMTTEKVLRPRVAEEDTLAPIREEWNIRIPPGKDRTGERALQIRFLENLIALKKKKGETDQVTVYASNGAGKDWDDRQSLGYKPRPTKRRTAAHDSSEDEDANGHAGENNNEDGDGDGDGYADGRQRRGRRRASGRRRARTRRGGRRDRGGTAGQGGPAALSAPTPSQWDRLSGPAAEYEEPPDFDEDFDDPFNDDEAGDVTMTGHDLTTETRAAPFRRRV